ncbi:ankyrin repeat-containing protein [Tilletia horrida]|uniref:Ankyrin repeat-containing protein n=1 Tax=Tilletia horrida TaxID=155126 RepID=A0AAN6GPJ0_9BASI|nr:ankyrin repeat-containing protein [Tilletia horrida]KAK0551764.1 ankyrin repeat-containing protein [Tilletia horrida]
MSGKTLSAEMLDDILYFARAGEVADLRETIEAAAGTSSVQDILSEAFNEQGNGPLHFSCANGHLETVQYLLPLLSLELLLHPNQSGNTPLHWAALNGNLDVVKALTSRIEEASTSGPEAAAIVSKIKAEQRSREQARKQSLNSSTEAPTEQQQADKVSREQDEEDHRPVWDCRNSAGRGPMSEAQMAEKENVVQFLLEHSLAGAPPAATDEDVGDRDTQSTPAVSAGADATKAAVAADGSQPSTAGDSVAAEQKDLSEGVAKVSLQ